MKLPQAFRLSFYAMLAVCCVCLFYSEWDFLPWMTLLLPVVAVLMVVAYRREGHAYMSERAANRLGSCIGVGTILWIALKIPRNDQELIAGGVPWPAALVPLLAPLLPILLMVKLFRPKSLTDFWIFQTIGLVIVTLSCILAGEAWFFPLLMLFLLVDIWCLSLFFVYRQAALAENPDAAPEDVRLFGKKAPRRLKAAAYPGLRRALLWCLPVVFLGLTGFFLLPRYTDSPWVPSKLSSPARVSIKSGIDATNTLDLFREGKVELSPDPAFDVQVRNRDGTPGVLPPSQHWRCEVLDDYRHGTWKQRQRHQFGNERPDLLPEKVKKEPLPSGAPAGMGENDVFLILQVNEKSGGLPLADAAAPAQVGLFPQGPAGPAERQFLMVDRASDIYRSTGWYKEMLKKNTGQYGQILTPSFRGWSVPSLLHAAHAKVSVEDRKSNQAYVSYLLNQEVPASIRQWTQGLLAKLPELDKTDIELDEQGRLPPAKHAKVARALSRHLAESGEFTYSLHLHRLGRTGMDPTAEFLLKVKDGHCERYAAGLALMLRSLYIPARVVKGFHGCDRTGKGSYVIRLNQAHSWVEALVPGNEPGTKIWVQLDPTPSSSAAEDPVLPFFNWMWTRVSNPDFMWKTMVMEYNTERQNEVSEQFQHLWAGITAPSDAKQSRWEAVWNMVRWHVLIFLALVVPPMGYWAVKRWFRAGRARSAPSPLSFYAKLLKILDRRCQLRPQPGQTPREFGQLARNALLGRAKAVPWAELPVRAAETLYRLRFAGQPVGAEECRALESQVGELEAALRNK